MYLVNLTVLFTFSQPIIINRKKNFSGEIIKKYACSFTLFSSGKILVTGKQSYREKEELVARLLKDRGCVGEILSGKIVNIVFTGKVHLKTSWQQTTSLGFFVYEPELFPSCVWRSGSAMVSLFFSGKYIITGVKSESTAHEIEHDFLEKISPLL